ncbi:MAG TPA: hypothetical protein VF235_08925 [Actinomycetota bacterium]
MLAALLPEIDGLLPAIFFVLLVTLAGAVGLFATYVIVQQFRNPGRR